MYVWIVLFIRAMRKCTDRIDLMLAMVYRILKYWSVNENKGESVHIYVCSDAVTTRGEQSNGSSLVLSGASCQGHTYSRQTWCFRVCDKFLQHSDNWMLSWSLTNSQHLLHNLVRKQQVESPENIHGITWCRHCQQLRQILLTLHLISMLSMWYQVGLYIHVISS